MFDVNLLKGKGSTDQHKAFLSVLVDTKRVIYDWGQDVVWVWPGEDEYPKSESETLMMWGEELHGYLSGALCAMNWPTSAGFLVDLLACGFKVMVAIKTPHTLNQVAEFFEAARAQKPEGELGKLEEFEPKYSKEG